MKKALKLLALPLLAAAFPILFYYAQNAWSLTLGSLVYPLAASLLAAAAAYAVFLLAQRRPETAALSAVLFVAAYYLYGLAYRLLVKWDAFSVEHYTLLPAMLAVVGYAGLLVSKLRPAPARVLSSALLVGVFGLSAYNLGSLLWVEAQEYRALEHTLTPSTVHAAPPAGEAKKLPDIYYIVFDEYAGFDVLRNYWHESYGDTFESFLKEKGFFVAGSSRSVTLSTITELVSRLDLRQYPEKTDAKITVAAIRSNKVMQVVKQHGYTTVVMDMAFSDIRADSNMQLDPAQVGGMAADEFRQEFFDQTMYLAFSTALNPDNVKLERQSEVIHYSLERTASLEDIPSPKFVYTHVLLPHQPFIFDENGDMLDPVHQDDWNYYLGQHKYATKLARELVTRLLENADPDNPPVIILQSDHGARNLKRRTKDSDKVVLNGYLEKYPISNAYHILNAMYLPGFDTSTLPDNIAPIDTFVVVLNHYLDAGVQVEQYTGPTAK